MIDDIVTRLRMSADLMIEFPKMLAKNISSQWIFEAADEIERLRTELADWQRTVRALEAELAEEQCR